MTAFRRIAVVAALLLPAALPAMPTAGAAGYDYSNPASTGCVNKGQTVIPGSARTYGPWTIDLRRSSGCSTVWARAVRTDGKRCLTGGTNCARIRIVRVRSDGTRSQTTWRRMQDGTKAIVSFQLNATSGATFTGTITKISGVLIGSTASIRI